MKEKNEGRARSVHGRWARAHHILPRVARIELGGRRVRRRAPREEQVVDPMHAAQRAHRQPPQRDVLGGRARVATPPAPAVRKLVEGAEDDGHGGELAEEGGQHRQLLQEGRVRAGRRVQHRGDRTRRVVPCAARAVPSRRLAPV
eukprot:2504154-Prymnesium_polylepis.1